MKVYSAAARGHERGGFYPNRGMQWYYSKNASQFGPVPVEELRAKVAAGEVGPSDLVWKDGMPDWTPAGSVPELGTRPPLVSSGYDTKGYDRSPAAPAASPYETPVTRDVPPMAYPMSAPTSGLAIASLVCGIMGMVTCLFLPGLPAVVCGHLALGRIAASGGRLGGRGMAIAGLVTGYLSLLVLVGFVVLMAFGIMASDPVLTTP